MNRVEVINNVSPLCCLDVCDVVLAADPGPGGPGPHLSAGQHSRLCGRQDRQHSQETLKPLPRQPRPR